jgi:hypothetical protein
MNILRFALLGLAAIAALLLGQAFLQQVSVPDDHPPAELKMEAELPLPEIQRAPPIAIEEPTVTALRNQIEVKIEASPDYMRFFDRLRNLYPGDYDAFLAEAAKHAAETGETGSADVLISEAVRILRQSHGILAAKADLSALERIFKIQLAMLQALGATDPSLCVDFLYGGASGGFFQFSADNRPLITDMALAGLEAIGNGQKNRIERTEPNTADFAILETVLRGKGLESNEIEALLDGKATSPPLEDIKMCHLGEIYLQSLIEMPEPTRSRIYGLAVELMARS